MFDLVASIVMGTAIVIFTIAVVFIVVTDYIDFRKEMK